MLGGASTMFRSCASICTGPAEFWLFHPVHLTPIDAQRALNRNALFIRTIVLRSVGEFVNPSLDGEAEGDKRLRRSILGPSLCDCTTKRLNLFKTRKQTGRTSHCTNGKIRPHMPKPKLLQLPKSPRQFNKCTYPLEDQQVNNVDRCPGKHARYKKNLERPLMNQLFIQTFCVGQMANRKDLNNKPCVFRPLLSRS